MQLSVDYDRFEDKFYRYIQYNPPFEQRECLKALLGNDYDNDNDIYN